MCVAFTCDPIKLAIFMAARDMCAMHFKPNCVVCHRRTEWRLRYEAKTLCV